MGSAARPALTSPLIRPARAGDAEGLSSLLAVLGYPCTAEEARERVLRVADDPDQHLCVAEAHGELLGLLCYDLMYYLPLGAPTCRITALSVAEGVQRRGIGRLLLREAEARAREAGAVRIELTSASHRLEAHAFYRACGYVDGALRFVKRLGGA
jgi:ribosomal protein S18 acetylase RimI-like enzyme